MKQYYADKRPLNLLCVVILIATACIIGVIYYYLYFIPWLKKLLIGIVIAAAVWTAFIWLPCYFKKASYLISPETLVCSTGFLWRTKKIMRTSSVQYVTLFTFPFLKTTGFNFLLVSALGGKLLMPFLSEKDAKEILRRISPDGRLLQ